MSLVSGRKGGVEESLIGGGAVAVVAAIQAAVAAAGVAVGERERESGCPWDKDTFRRAAMGRNRALLKWARANGCPGLAGVGGWGRTRKRGKGRVG